jgi:hypothetical protein
MLLARRSNNELDTAKIAAEYPALPPVAASMRALMERIRASRA